MVSMNEILSVEIIFRAGPTMKLFLNEIYDFNINSVPIVEVDLFQINTEKHKCESVSFKVKECEDRPIWSFELKATMNYFDWIMQSGTVKSIKFNLQGYQKRTLTIPFNPGPMGSNKYQCSEILENGDLSISIVKAA